MFDQNDPSTIWISPSGAATGDGTFENPFGAIERALEFVKPGATIVLRRGTYAGRDVTFDIAGTMHEPIRIMAEPGAAVEIRNASWFFYDMNDCVVSGFTFRDAPAGAISVLGSSSRNRFADLRFINCGASGKTSCALFFGGSGGSCNMVENCLFENCLFENTGTVRAESIGLMVSSGDSETGAQYNDHIISRNRFVNYDYGILMGTGDAAQDWAGPSGHMVERNVIEACRVEGILVKYGDTTVRNNLVLRCTENSIAIAAGRDSTIESNRIIDCANGIAVNGEGHTVANNCVVRCRGQGIRACGADPGRGRQAASGLLVENNTCIDCGEKRIAGVAADAGTSSIVRRNLFSGTGAPVQGTGQLSLLTIENIAANGCETVEGVAAAEASFKNPAGDDFTNDSGCGASGWVLTPVGNAGPAIETADETDSGYCESQEPLDEDVDEEVEPATDSAVDGEEPADFESFMNRFYSKELTIDDTAQQ